MGGDWQEMPFSEAVDINPSVSLERGEIYPFVDMGAVQPGTRSVRPSEARAFTGGGSRFQDGDVLMARITPCLENGKIGRYYGSADGSGAHGSTEFIVIRGRPSVTDTGFAYYLTQWEEVKEYAISQMTGSSGRQRVPITSLDHLLVPLPPLREQRAIAHVLGTLDDKIELNRRTSETLEGMARALFKSWFVDFDPVRAKLEGRDPGLTDHVADVFPDSFEDSEVGEIPTGWSRHGLGEWARALSGGTPSRKRRALWGGRIPWISPKVMTALHADETDEQVTEDAIGNGTRLAPAGSTLVMVRGMGLHQAVRVSQAQREVAFNQDVKALVPSKIDANLLLFALLDAQQDLLGRVESSGHGTGRLPTDVLLDHPITLPTDETQRMLSRPFSSMNHRIALAREECRVLGALRDTLLPRLISGELRVPDVERFVEVDRP